MQKATARFPLPALRQVNSSCWCPIPTMPIIQKYSTSTRGLPGMILGVALPHENVTWFATKVTDTPLPPNVVIPPKKGKPLDNKGYREMLINALKDHGPIVKDLIKGFLF